MTFEVETKGHGDIIDITPHVEDVLLSKPINDGIACLFVSGSTAAITTMEFEEGIIKDINEVFEKIAPEDFPWEHHKKWGDHNGAAHIRSALIGVSQVIPIEEGKLKLGTWQQAVLIDFDERPRKRIITVKIVKSNY